MTTRPICWSLTTSPASANRYHPFLQDEGYEVDSVASAGKRCNGRPQAKLSDPAGRVAAGMDGLEALSRCKLRSVPGGVMISGQRNHETAVRATKLGAFDFIEKRSPSKKSLFWCATPFSNAGCRKRISFSARTGPSISSNWRQRAEKAIAPANLPSPRQQTPRPDLRREWDRQRAGGARFARRESSQ